MISDNQQDPDGPEPFDIGPKPFGLSGARIEECHVRVRQGGERGAGSESACPDVAMADFTLRAFHHRGRPFRLKVARAVEPQPET